jgi:hypothetical protein
MKIRIHDDSVRCRLGRRELGDLVASEFLVATTRFPTGRLRFGLSLDAELATPVVDCVDGLVGVGLPREAFTAWARGNEESYAFAVPLDDGVLNVLIEKDFPCDTRAGCATSDDLFTPTSMTLWD